MSRGRDSDGDGERSSVTGIGIPAVHVVLSEQMRHRFTLVSVVALALVLQGMVALAPHQHGPERTDGPDLHELVSVDEPHHCLACATHAPLVVPAGCGGVIRATIAAETPPIDAETAAVVVDTAVFDPRGPPSA